MREECQEIVRAVDTFLKTLLEALPACPPVLKEALLYSTLSAGKRFRPLLVFASADLFSLPQAAALRLAVAVELIHAYSLIHDDLPAMDNAHWRRGKPACHLAFSEALAILAGDSLIPLAFEVLLHEDVHPSCEKRLHILGLFAKAIGCEGMVAGQVYDVTTMDTPVTQEQLVDLQGLKTGALINFSLKAPAFLTNQPNSTLKALDLYGTHLALVFQIKDDVLDLYPQEHTGKDQRKDAHIQKKTWVTLWGETGARHALQEHARAATAALTCWGDRAKFLREILDFALTRKQ